MKNCIQNSACKANSLMIAGYGYALACCTTDYCNSSVLKKPNYILNIITILALIFFTKRFK